MDQENILDEDAQKELSPEEYAKQRADAMEHLAGEIAYLEVEEKYQGLLADIEQHKTRRMTMIGQRVQYYAQQKGPQLDENGNPIDVDPASASSEDKSKKNKRSLKPQKHGN